MTYEIRDVRLGADTPRAWQGSNDDWERWYREPTGMPSPCARHEEALRALPDIAFIREWGKQWKTRKPAQRAPRENVAALKARIAELEEALMRLDSMIAA